MKLLSSFCLVAMVSPLSYASTSSNELSPDIQRQILLNKIKKNQDNKSYNHDSPVNTARNFEQEKRDGEAQYQLDEGMSTDGHISNPDQFNEKMLTEEKVTKNDPFALRRLGKKKQDKQNQLESNELDKGVQFDETMPTDEQVENHQKMMQEQEELKRNNYKPKKQSSLRTPNTSFEDETGQDPVKEPKYDPKSEEEMKQNQEEMRKLLDLKAKMEKQTKQDIEMAQSKIKQLTEKTKQHEEYITQLGKAAEKTKMDLEQAQKDKVQQEQEIKKTQESLAIAERNLKEITGDKK